MSFLNFNKAQIYFDSVGAETWKPIFLINGHTRSSTDFRMFVRYLESKQIRCILIDNRGCGRTETSEVFTLEDMTSDVLAVADHLNIQKFSVLGISMGGFIAQKLAFLHPTRVEKLILVSTTASKRWFIRQNIPWSQDLDMVRKKLTVYFAPDFPSRNAALFDSMAKQILNAIANGRYLENAKAQSSAVDGVSEFEEEISSIVSQTLIIHGAEDQIISSEAALDMHARIKNSQLEIYQGIGHLILAEFSRKLYEDVANFILAD